MLCCFEWMFLRVVNWKEYWTVWNFCGFLLTIFLADKIHWTAHNNSLKRVVDLFADELQRTVLLILWRLLGCSR